MKKKILTILIFIITIICVACACSEDTSAIEQIKTNENTEMFSLVETIGLPTYTTMYILVDNDTKVMYALTIANGSYNRGSTSIIPLYDEYGNLKLYKN